MIAQRFRALGWVGGIATAATGLYLISLQVAAERAKLEEVDRRIGAAQRQMQTLKTELSTRASYRQLEKWNDEDLTMAAPRAAQYFKSEAQLASLSPESLDPAPERMAPRAQLAAATTVPAAPAVSATVAAAPQLRNANYVTAAVEPSVSAKPQRVVMVARPALDKDTLGDLVRTAAQERRTRP